MQKHEWHEHTEDGDTRFVRACFHAGRWTFEDTLKSDTDWQSHESLPLSDLEKLRELLWNKYQRGRVPHGHVKYVEGLIEEAREAEENDE